LSVGTWLKNCSVVMLLSWVAAVSEPQVLLPRKVIERSASGVGLVLIDDAEAIAGREADRRREGRHRGSEEGHATQIRRD
jgi:hypothetical protein